MTCELIRKAATAIQHAVEARTVEYQVKHADEARHTFEQAMRLTEVRLEAAANKPGPAARMIAEHAAGLEIAELKELEQQLCAVEERIATALVARAAPQDFRQLRLAE
jgi:hemerythrin-like domain-containing protein